VKLIGLELTVCAEFNMLCLKCGKKLSEVAKIKNDLALIGMQDTVMFNDIVVTVNMNIHGDGYS